MRVWHQQVLAALWFKAKGSMSSNVDREDPDVAFCDDMLCKVCLTPTCRQKATQAPQTAVCRTR